MPATRLMPTEIGQDLIELTREIVDKELRPIVDEAERRAAPEALAADPARVDEVFPREVFTTLGQAGLLSRSKVAR